MTNNDSRNDCGNLRDIPEQVQNLSTEELGNNEHAVPRSNADEGNHQNRPRSDPPACPEPGQTRYDDSINASSEDPGGSRSGYDFNAGHEMTAATSVGKTDDPNYNEDLQRRNDGRDQADGTLSHRQAEWDKKRITQAISSDLPISKRQRETVVLAMQQLNLDRFGHQKGIERVCLGVAAVIVNDEREEQASSPEEVTPLSWEDQFKDLAAKYDISMSDLSTIKEIVREELGDRPPTPAVTGIRRDRNLPKTSPSEKPDEYWDRLPARYWVHLARTWKHVEDDLKKEIPDQHRKHVDSLRNWKPWDRADEPAPSDDEVHSNHDPAAKRRCPWRKSRKRSRNS